MLDTELVASIVAGDPDGLAAAYHRYANPLYTYCRTILPDPADAADAVQDTFVLAASKIGSLRDPERFRSWLYAIARNESLRQLRERKQTSALDEVPDMADESVDVNEDVARAERTRLVREALPGLNAGEREVIELQLRHQLEPAEMASVLGVSRNHVHSLLSRAREQLEVCLAVLVVGKTGRDDCRDLASMLSDWDGQLTVLLRKRVSRHIQNCPTCTSRRAFALKPAAFFAPGGVALAMLAAPAVLKGEVSRLGLGTGAAAVAHRAAVTAKAGSFGSHGFPRPVRTARAGHHPAFHQTPRGHAAAAGAVAAAVAAAVVLLALAGHDGHVKGTEAGPSAPARASAAIPSSGTPSSGTPSSGTPLPGPGTKTPASSRTTAPLAQAPTPKGTSTGASLAVSAPSQATSGPDSTSPSSAQSPAPATTTGGGTSASTSPASPPAATAAPVTGTITVSPASIVLSPLLGGSFTITAHGGPVSWSVAEPSSLIGSVSLSQASGTVSPGSPVTVTVTTSLASLNSHITVYPGGEQVAILLGLL